jgi:hypothetical protein
MSLAEFDTLRRWHPNEEQLVDELRNYIVNVGHEPHVVIDERIICATLKVPRGSMEQFLVELVKLRVLRPEFFWVCPRTGGTVWNGNDLTQVPSWIMCEECGDVHFYAESDIRADFVLSETLLRDLRNAIA